MNQDSLRGFAEAAKKRNTTDGEIEKGGFARMVKRHQSVERGA